LSLRAWGLLGGVEWTGLEVVAEMLGIHDIESLVVDLATIRDWQNRSKD
jgi:hypothetical protein